MNREVIARRKLRRLGGEDFPQKSEFAGPERAKWTRKNRRASECDARLVDRVDRVQTARERSRLVCNIRVSAVVSRRTIAMTAQFTKEGVSTRR